MGFHAPHAHDKMDLAFFYIQNINGESVPWAPSQTDLLGDDWKLW